MTIGPEEITKLLKMDGFLKNFTIDVKEASNGRFVIEMPLEEKVMRIGGIMNGGAIMALCDLVGGLSILTKDDVINQVTINIDVNFLRPIAKGPVKAVGESVRIGKTIGYSEMVIYDGNGEECAKGSGNWFLFR
ncbi:MAG: PaaI family thioesterase [Thermoplasmata archaeon]